MTRDNFFLKYLFNTPENTNSAMIKQMLEHLINNTLNRTFVAPRYKSLKIDSAT